MAKSVMMVVFVLPSSLRRWVSGRTEVKVFAVGADRDSPPTLGSALDMLRRTHPLLEERIRDEYGRIRRHISMIVCGENSRGLGGLDCAMPPGAEVYVLPALA
ncbi:molybdopterin synthase sulfur carrier subunit [Nonomuraea sp. NPDC049714]|uniref:molybdopterin synthase sulfur carrier subunit n=1 Tax=unclassified Nonomuraea TaxID=2593643 RepID=UPI0037B5E0B0